MQGGAGGGGGMERGGVPHLVWDTAARSLQDSAASSAKKIRLLEKKLVLLWPKKFFSWKLLIWVSKKCRILCWFQIRWCRLSEMPLTKVKSKKPRKNAQNSTFCYLKMQMRKNLYIFKHLAKSKKSFFCQYLSFSAWFPLSLKHLSPLIYKITFLQ